MLTFTNHETGKEDLLPEVKLPAVVNSLSFSYDGGRVFLAINGKEVFSSRNGGNDCALDLDNK
jgi:hypothetical protein